MGSTGKGIDFFNGFLGDLLIISAAFLPIFLIFGLVALKNKNLASFLMGIVSFIFWLFMVPVQAYYHAYTELADAILLGCGTGFSYLNLLKSLPTLHWVLPFFILVFTGGAILWLLVSKRVLFSNWLGKVFAAIFLVSFPMALEVGLNTEFFSKNDNRISKPFYYIKTSVLCVTGGGVEKELPLTGPALYHSLHNQSTFVSPEEYPFLRTFSQSDCFDSLVSLSSQKGKPDVVFLIVESLSEPFIVTFKGLTLMPFLSNLAKSSLYWENFFATSQRSPGALPSIMAGLPFAEDGFSQIPLIPYHFSLINVFNFNDYLTSYYTGNWTWENSTDKFLELNNTDWVFDAADFPVELREDIKDYDGSFWGYHDKDLIDFYFDQKASLQNSLPTFDVIQTGSTRWPFPVENVPVYEERFDELLEGIKDLEIREYFELRRKYFYALMFSDDMIRTFFEKISAKESYNNTIFIITGNATMPDIIADEGIEKYKVPFMIYSPLVNEPQKIQSVACHADIYETIVGLMASQMDFKVPPYSVSVGGNLCFSNNTGESFIPFADSTGQVSELYYNGYFLDFMNRVFKIENGKTKNKVNNPEINASMINYLDAYNAVNATVSDGLMPDSLFFEYFGYKVLKDTVVTGQRVRNEYRNILQNIPIGSGLHYIDVQLDNPQVALEEVFVVFELRNSSDSILKWKNYGIPEKKDGFSVRIVLDEPFDENENGWLQVFIWNESPVPYSFDRARTILFKKDSPSGFQSERYDR
jgi:phosphoglycerol transferase MdoB-like AlkP superfamily enzyme